MHYRYICTRYIAQEKKNIARIICTLLFRKIQPQQLVVADFSSPDGMWVKTVLKSGGAGLHGLVAPPRGQQSEEVVAWVRWVLDYVCGLTETSGSVYVIKWKLLSADDLLCCFDYSLEWLFVCSSAASIPHQDAIGEYALHRAVTEGCQQLLSQFNSLWAWFTRILNTEY